MLLNDITETRDANSLDGVAGAIVFVFVNVFVNGFVTANEFDFGTLTGIFNLLSFARTFMSYFRDRSTDIEGHNHITKTNSTIIFH